MRADAPLPTDAPMTAPSNPKASKPAASALVHDVAGLVSPPDICVRIFDLIQSEDSTAADIGEVIGQDPNLTSRLLKIVNSPFYGLQRKVDTLSRAVAVIGIRDLYNLVVAVSAVRSFSRIASDLVNIDTFWRHSLFTGIIARRLAQECNVLHPERLFIAGLLHDVGSLVLYHQIPDTMRDLLLVAEGDEQLLHRLEVEELGYSHADLGALLLDIWRLPAALRDSVAYHHWPSSAHQGVALEASLVHLADVIANRSELGSYCQRPEVSEPSPVVSDPRAWELTHLDADSFDEDAVIAAAGTEFIELSSGLVGA